MRSMILYMHEPGSMPFIIARKKYQADTQAQELQIAHDFACEHDVDEGHISIMEHGYCINKIPIGCTR